MKRARRRRRTLPMTLYELAEAGGPEGMARAAADKAAVKERRFWLGVLKQLDQDDALVSLWMRDLRRRLGIKAPVKLIRAQTRERVRRFRERQRAEYDRAHPAPPAP